MPPASQPIQRPLPPPRRSRGPCPGPSTSLQHRAGSRSPVRRLCRRSLERVLRKPWKPRPCPSHRPTRRRWRQPRLPGSGIALSEARAPRHSRWTLPLPSRPPRPGRMRFSQGVRRHPSSRTRRAESARGSTRSARGDGRVGRDGAHHSWTNERTGGWGCGGLLRHERAPCGLRRVGWRERLVAARSGLPRTAAPR